MNVFGVYISLTWRLSFGPFEIFNHVLIVWINCIIWKIHFKKIKSALRCTNEFFLSLISRWKCVIDTLYKWHANTVFEYDRDIHFLVVVVVLFCFALKFQRFWILTNPHQVVFVCFFTTRNKNSTIWSGDLSIIIQKKWLLKSGYIFCHIYNMQPLDCLKPIHFHSHFYWLLKQQQMFQRRGKFYCFRENE